MERQALFLLLSSLTFVGISAQNYSLELDSYWQLRAQEAERHYTAAYNPDPFNVTDEINYHARRLLENDWKNSTRRMLGKKYKGPCLSANPIDDCWRCRDDWDTNRKRLAECALGFGRGTTGGKDGRIYVVNDASDDDMVNPKPGTLRHAVVQEEPLWIIFARGMTIELKQELIIASDKTIDGRGANVVIANGGGIMIQYAQNIIIHGVRIRNIKSCSGGLIRDSASHFGMRGQSDGDAITIFGSQHIWIDHCSFSNAYDGLIDIIMGSTAITISNCHMTKHGKVFLFGARDEHVHDKRMQITVAYNHFGKKLEQRMPRCRFGFIHLINNDYTHWEMYAVGGSQKPTIISQGNRFIAPPNPRAKEITHRVTKGEAVQDSGTWTSEEDLMMNGAFFVESGTPLPRGEYKRNMIKAMPGTMAAKMTRLAGPLTCEPNKPC